jgi:hypothetical protein
MAVRQKMEETKRVIIMPKPHPSNPECLPIRITRAPVLILPIKKQKASRTYEYEPPGAA